MSIFYLRTFCHYSCVPTPNKSDESSEKSLSLSVESPLDIVDIENNMNTKMWIWMYSRPLKSPHLTYRHKTVRIHLSRGLVSVIKFKDQFCNYKLISTCFLNETGFGMDLKSGFWDESGFELKCFPWLQVACVNFRKIINDLNY